MMWMQDPSKPSSRLAFKKMQNSNDPRIGLFGRYVLFSGTGMACLACGVFVFEALARVVGERALPFAILVAIGFVVIGTQILFEVVPKRFVIPAGVGGWILTFALLFLHALK
jgi:hypothetical protein